MKKSSEKARLSLFARVLLAATFLLVVAGGVVTSTDSGLSVPDWPTSYGWNMFLFPVSKWVGNIRFEHTHRLIASGVGLLTVLFTVLVFRSGARRWFKVLSAAALTLVVVQGLLGGLTVKLLLPTPVSVAHACLAQTFFCMTVAVAFFTLTPTLSRRERVRATRAGEGTRLLWWSLAAFAAVYVQLVLGAWMRHSGAGLAIPDFPASFGRVFPDHWDGRIALNFAHRAWALVVAAVVASAALVALKKHNSSGLQPPARFLLVLLPVQLLLGALAIWTGRAVPVTVAHVASGALLLGGTVWLGLESWRRALPAGRMQPFGAENSDQTAAPGRERGRSLWQGGASR